MIEADPGPCLVVEVIDLIVRIYRLEAVPNDGNRPTS
jgi:hypothetical protein